jgi:hypothetical protein
VTDQTTQGTVGPTIAALALDFDLTLAAQNKSPQTRSV